ncbi:hypothetical protein CL176_07075 [Suicoccus acidiformans]|uniref:PTS EIIB type-4 domain-containing protein n=2 Tax=Suicoccus acidiformans TaxID=2036206 RepID=A0A347WL18_9LACT|nr:hypothetical protein CL176_07075 [Suicoccus acidiformans]
MDWKPDTGVQFDAVNLGSMAHTEGKTMVSRAISVDQDDIQTLKGIQDRGVKFDMRKALDDSPENLEHLLKKDNLI